MSEYAGKIVTGVVLAVMIGSALIAALYYLPQVTSSTTLSNGSSSASSTTACVTTSTYSIFNTTASYPSVSVCPLNAVVTQIITGDKVTQGPAAVALDPNNSLIYVVNFGQDGTVSVIDPQNNSVLGSYSVGYTPDSITYDPSDQDMYITNRNANNVTVFSPKTNSVIQVIPVSDLPNAVVYNPLNGQLDVLEQGPTIGDTILYNNQIVGQLSTNVTGLGASDAILDTTNHELYIADTFQNAVTVLDADNNSLVKSIRVSNGSSEMAFDSSNGYIYVTNGGANTVTVISSASNSVVTTISVGYGATPAGICFDSANGYVFEANVASGTVDAISAATNTLVGQVTLQGNSQPTGVYCDSVSNRVYVIDWGIGNVSVISFP